MNIFLAHPATYRTYGNRDFGTIKGLTIAYDLRRTGNIRMTANYTLQFAEGTGSDATSAAGLINAGLPNLRNIFPYSYDQRHAINVTFDYRYGSGEDYNGPMLGKMRLLENTGLNIFSNIYSGSPYSNQAFITDEAIGTLNAGLDGTLNGSRLPWSYRLDLQLDKTFNLEFGSNEDKKKMAFLNVYVRVTNLLNQFNILNVYRATGNWDDDGYLAAASSQSSIQNQIDEQAFRDYYMMKIQNPLILVRQEQSDWVSNLIFNNFIDTNGLNVTNMKKQFFATLIGLSLSINGMAYLGPNDKKGGDDETPKGANCSPATARLTMEFNDVSAYIEQGGSMFQNRQEGTPGYEVPKGSDLYAIYAGALWMGGTDVNGQLKLAALRYRQGNDFWPGPLTVNPGSGDYNPLYPVGDLARRDYGEANIDPDQCQAYDKFYTIRKAEVIAFNIWYECNAGIATEGCDDIETPSNDVLKRIYAWPAHGDVSRGQDYFLAPYYDRDEDGNYNPDNGDHPWYDDILGRDDVECGVDRRVTLYGDETHWWVFNDKGNIHTETTGDPIGMEIRAQAFAFATNDEVNLMTFYNYELINRGTQTLYDTYFSQYLDCDIGNYVDDYVGCDVSRGLGYTYNGDLIDESSTGTNGYGENPPAIGCDFFEGPYQDADGLDNPGPYIDSVTNELVPNLSDALNNGGIVYNGIGVGYQDGLIDNERFGMRRFTYYTSTSQFPYNDPGVAAEYYNFMEGQWANGSEMYYGGLGAGGESEVLSDYMFPGNSDPLNWGTGGIDMSADWPDGWYEATPGLPANPVGDRRFVQSAGPFTLRPGAINNITVGLVYGRSSDGGLLASVEAMKQADTKAQAFLMLVLISYLLQTHLN